VRLHIGKLYPTHISIYALLVYIIIFATPFQSYLEHSDTVFILQNETPSNDLDISKEINCSLILIFIVNLLSYAIVMHMQYQYILLFMFFIKSRVKNVLCREAKTYIKSQDFS